MNHARMAAIAALEEIDDLFVPLTTEQRIEAMEELIEELESRIRCEEAGQ